MTDITDDQRRGVLGTARAILDKPYDHTAAAGELASFILATVDAPAPTLAEELRGQAEWARRIGAPCNAEKIDSLAARAEKIEQENEEQREWNLAVNEQAGILARERDDARDEVERLTAVAAPERTLAEELARIAENSPVWTIQNVCDELKSAADRAEQMERDLEEARAEVERLVGYLHTADHNHAFAVEKWTQMEMERDEARAEVERLTAVQKGAESNAESIDPADVPPGEAWIVEVNGKRGTAVKDSGGVAPWSVVIDGAYSSRCDEFITLVSRLVPAPRVITNAEELDALAEGSIVRDRAGHAWERYPDEDWYSTEELDDGFSSRRLADYAGPVTVLWEPEA